MANSFSKRYMATVTIEAKTPLKVGSSDVDMLQDSPVQKDFNGLPMIFGTSIAGVLRKEFSKEEAEDIFGGEFGSRLIISNALLVDDTNKVNETLLTQKSNFLKIFETLPQREHTAITHQGVAKENSKFDEEVVYKGSRFRFGVEFLSDKEDDEAWGKIISVLHSEVFRLGGGTTKGFGDVAVIEELSSYDIFELESDGYREKTSSLNEQFSKPFTATQQHSHSYITYTLTITPEDFFMFGSGFGDDDADMTPVYEDVIVWNENNKPSVQKQNILIPASSIKGAISHRVAYHYNKAKEVFADNLNPDELEQYLGENNEAVKALFGHKKESDEGGKELGQKGKILIGDCFKADHKQTKVFDHVSIDRFTGGAIDGALFQEKTIAKNGEDDSYEIEILVENSIDGEILQAFEKALTDITTGQLPLGGATTKGHGVFNGKWSKSEAKDEN